MSPKQRKELANWGFLLGLMLLFLGGIIFLSHLGDDDTRALCNGHEMQPTDTCITYEGGHQTGEYTYSQSIPEPGTNERTRHTGLIMLSIGVLMTIGSVVMYVGTPARHPVSAGRTARRHTCAFLPTDLLSAEEWSVI